ncbi:MAG: hypothetical protein methR_P3246 [Methyloprofundus sp.]|nr:MAG: hypothetical protein methR_P3246 [Methyloprofundus sp.]
MKKIITKTALVTCLALPCITIAAPITIESTTTQTQDFTFSTLSESTILTFDGFDSTLGTLNGVHFEWTTDKTLISQVLNLGGTTQSIGTPTPVTATSTTNFAGQGIAVDLSDSNDLTTPGYVGSIAPSSFTIVNGTIIPTPFTIGSVSESSSGSICLSNHADVSCGSGLDDLQAYVTNALLSFDMSVSNTSSIFGSVNGIFITNNGTVDGSVSIYYDYSATTPQSGNGVPEPATTSLMGLGLSLLTMQGLIRRRRQSK